MRFLFIQCDWDQRSIFQLTFLPFVSIDLRFIKNKITRFECQSHSYSRQKRIQIDWTNRAGSFLCIYFQSAAGLGKLLFQRKRRFVTPIALLGFGAAQPQQEHPQKPKMSALEDLLQSADQLFDENQYQEALDELKKYEVSRCHWLWYEFPSQIYSMACATHLPIPKFKYQLSITYLWFYPHYRIKRKRIYYGVRHAQRTNCRRWRWTKREKRN